MEPEPHVPYVRSMQVLGEDGSALWCMAHAGEATGNLVAQDADRRNLAIVRLTRASCMAAVNLLLAMAESLPPE